MALQLPIVEIMWVYQNRNTTDDGYLEKYSELNPEVMQILLESYGKGSWEPGKLMNLECAKGDCGGGGGCFVLLFGDCGFLKQLDSN